MKIGAREVDSFVRAPGGRCHAALIYGPDGGLVSERSKQIAAQILGPKPDPLNRIDLTGDQLKSDPARLRDELFALSLMGGSRVVVVQNLSEKNAPLVGEALEGGRPEAYLIVEAEELGPSSSLRQLFERGDSLAAIACYRDEGRALEEVIRGTLSAAGLRVQPDALRYLAAHLGNDRGVTQSELAKIVLYMGDEKEVTLEAALANTDYNASESVDDICYAAGCGDAAQAQSLLARLLQEGTQPVMVVRALIRYFQRLEGARAQADGGMAVDQVVAAMRPPVFFKYTGKMKQAISLWQTRRLQTAQDVLLRAEREMKSSLSSTPALVLSHALQQTARLAGR